MKARDRWALFGLAWGVPVPVAVLGADFAARGAAWSWAEAAAAYADRPWHWLFLAHPVLFAAVFGAVGAVRDRLDAGTRAVMARLEAAATRDALTGLLNHRVFFEALGRETTRLDRRRGALPAALSVLMIDIDRFKDINDRYGHQAGDAVLVHLAGILQGNARSYDIVARYGGEEFAVVLPETAAGAAAAIAERLRAKVEEARAPGNLRITISIGVATAGSGGTTPAEVVRRADEALYRAKRAGRNRVEACEPVYAAGSVSPSSFL